MARVLIVDDTEIVRRAMEVAIRRMGHATVATADASAALASISEQPPDLAVLDYMMPGMNGLTLLRRMRAQLGDRCPRVVFVTAAPLEELARDVAAAGGAFGFVKKPFHLDDLERMVGEALRAPAIASS